MHAHSARLFRSRQPCSQLAKSRPVWLPTCDVISARQCSYLVSARQTVHLPGNTTSASTFWPQSPTRGQNFWPRSQLWPRLEHLDSLSSTTLRVRLLKNSFKPKLKSSFKQKAHISFSGKWNCWHFVFLTCRYRHGCHTAECYYYISSTSRFINDLYPGMGTRRQWPRPRL